MTPEQLQKYWQENPDALKQAVAENPMGFLSSQMQKNFNEYKGKEQGVQNPTSLTDRLAGEDFAYVPGGRVQGVLTGGAYLPEQQQLASTSSLNLIDRLGLPKYKDIDGQRVYLNTGFGYTDGDYSIRPQKDAPIGSYSVVGVKDRGKGKTDATLGLLGMASGIINPLLGAAVTGLDARDPEGGLYGDLNQIGKFAGFVMDQRNPGRYGETYDPAVEENVPPGDVIGPGGLFDLTVVDTPQGGSQRPQEPQQQQQDGGGGASGGSSSGAPQEPANGPGEMDAPPEEDGVVDSPLVLGEYIGNGQMVLGDGRVTQAPPDFQGEVGDPVYEHPQGEEYEEIDGDAVLSTVFGDDGLSTGGLGSNSGLQVNPDGSIFNWNTGKYETPLNWDSVGTGTGTGTGTGNGSGDGSGDGSGRGSGAGGAAQAGSTEFDKFMSGISYVLPVLQELNIPLEDYIAMWTRK